VVLTLGLAGCQSVKRDLPDAATALPPPAPQPPPYLIQPGDILESHYAVDPTLDQQALVMPDGRVSFRYASDVPAAGTSLPQLRDLVASRAGIVDRGFDVVLRSSVGTRVYVTGEVTTPGEIQVNGEITALQAISRAGGFKLGAQSGEVVLLRHDRAHHAALYAVDLAAAADGTAPQDDVTLQTYDVLYVPRDRAGNVSMIFERIRNAIPFNFSLIYGNGNADIFK
jgi:polysaccharide export outer membrane protein